MYLCPNSPHVNWVIPWYNLPTHPNRVFTRKSNLCFVIHFDGLQPRVKIVTREICELESYLSSNLICPTSVVAEALYAVTYVEVPANTACSGLERVARSKYSLPCNADRLSIVQCFESTLR